jgi:hypothetical protein
MASRVLSSLSGQRIARSIAQGGEGGLTSLVL